MQAQDEQHERAALLARALSDYAAFCRTLVWVIPKNGQRTRLRFKRAQRRYNERRTWRDVVLKGRQVGMTTEGVARDVYKFVAEPGQRVVIVVQSITGNPALRQVSAMVRTMLDGLQQSGLRLDFGTNSESLWTLPDRDSRLQIIEAGASLAAAQKKGRGGTYSRVHITEAAFFEHPEATTNALFEGVPALPGTEIEVESTANGTNNWFHKLWIDAVAGTNGFAPHFIPWFDDESCVVPLESGEVIEPESEFEEGLVAQHGVTPEQIKFYRTKVSLKGSDLARQEYPSDAITAFLTSGRTYFEMPKLDEIAGAVKPPVETKGDLRIWEQPEPGAKYVIGVDPAEGLGEDGDFTYATVWNRKTRRHCATLRNRFDSNAFADELVPLAEWFNDAEIAVERNKGIALIRALERLKYQRIYYDPDDNKPGISTNTATRPVMLEELADAVRDGSFRTDDPVLVTEMRAFVRNPRDGKPYAPGKGRKNGASDDGIFSCAIAWRAMLIPPSNPKVHTGGERAFGGEAWRHGKGW